MLLDPDDLPAGFTVSLADPRAKDLGRNSPRGPEVYDADGYLRHATDKCRRWLAGLEHVQFQHDDDNLMPTDWHRHDNGRHGNATRDVTRVMQTSVSCDNLLDVGTTSTSSTSDDQRRLIGLSVEDVRAQQTSGFV